jgi:hypothetical protein
LSDVAAGLVPDSVPTVGLREWAVPAVGRPVFLRFERVGVGVVFGGQLLGRGLQGFENISDERWKVPTLGDRAPPRGRAGLVACDQLAFDLAEVFGRATRIEDQAVDGVVGFRFFLGGLNFSLSIRALRRRSVSCARRER